MLVTVLRVLWQTRKRAGDEQMALLLHGDVVIP